MIPGKGRVQVKRFVIVLLTVAHVGNLHAAEEKLHEFGSWSVVTWETPGGDAVYWAQTKLDAMHLLDEDDQGDPLRFGCSAATRPMTVFLLSEQNEGSVIFTDSYTVDWKVGATTPISQKGQRMTLFDPFDAPAAIRQLLKGEESEDSLVIRLSNPDKGTTEFKRNLVGDEWPKLYAAKLDGFKNAHDFIVEKCNE